MILPLDLVLSAVGYGIVVPAVITAGALILVLYGTKHQGHAVRYGGEALAMAAGLVAGLAALAGSRQLGWGFLKPADSWQWLPFLAVLALAVDAVNRAISLPASPRWCLRLAVACLTAWLLVRAESALQPVHLQWLGGLAVAVLALWELLASLASRWPGAALPALLVLVALAAAAVLELSGIMQFALVATVLAAVLAGCAGAAWWYQGQSTARAAVPAISVLIPGLLFAGYFNTFSDVPLASFLLVLAAPLALGATALLPLSKWYHRWHSVVRTGATLLPIGLALTLAALA